MNIRRAEELAKYYMQKHGIQTVKQVDISGKLIGWESGWKFEFCRSKNILGHCDFRTKTIRLSKSMTELRGEDEVVNTILHEIAHAVCPPVRVKKLKRTQLDSHHEAWKQYFLSIGGDGKRCGTIEEEVKEQIQYKYTYSCPTCGFSYGVHRLSKKKQFGILVSSCGKCHPSAFNRAYLLTITKNF